MTKPIPITIKRSSDPSMIEMWSDGALYATIHEDMFHPYINLKKLIGTNSQGSEALFELTLKE